MYTQTWIDGAEKRARRARFQCAGFLLIGLLIAAFGLIFRYKYVLIGGLVLGCAAAYFWYSMIVAPCAHYARFLTDIKAGQTRTATVTLIDVDMRAHVTEDGITVWDVTLSASEGEEAVYFWDVERNFPTLAGGKTLTLTSFGRYIIALSEME